MIASSHIKPMLKNTQRKIIVNWCVDILLNWTDKFDTIVVSGHSMTMIGTVVAHVLNKNILLIRKERTINSDYMIEGNQFSRCVMIDDCICTGDSIERCAGAIKEFDGEFVGFLLWSDKYNSKFYNTTYEEKAFNLGYGIELCEYE